MFKKIIKIIILYIVLINSTNVVAYDRDYPKEDAYFQETEISDDTVNFFKRTAIIIGTIMLLYTRTRVYADSNGYEIGELKSDMEKLKEEIKEIKRVTDPILKKEEEEIKIRNRMYEERERNQGRY